ncbi:MAG: TetR/AcrR family transcriptional regulator [Bacillota bacterium]
MSNSTKDKIIKAALNMFSDNNYHTTSMAMIADEADVSKGTLYWHFNSKEDLFREIVLTGLDYFQDNYKKIYSKNLKADNKLLEVISFSINVLNENIKLAKIIRNNGSLVSDDFQKKADQKHREAVLVIEKIIRQGVDEQIIITDNPRNTAVLILSVIFTAPAEWLFDQIKNTDTQIDFVYNFIMNGIKRREKNG